eukprot:gene33648-43303_t
MSMYTVLKNKICLFLETPDQATNRPPVYAINADKVTELRRTGQVVGMLTMIRGVIKALLLGDPPVTEGHDAKGVSKNIVTVLQGDFRLTVKSMRGQLSGMSFDGAYFKLGADKELCAQLEVDPDWILPGWDGGHKLEKVLDDVRWQDPSTEWYRKIAGDTAEVLSKISWGKGFEETLVVARDLQLKLMNPKAHCDTRFAQAERKVYENVAANFPIIVTHNQNLVAVNVAGLEMSKRPRARERATEAGLTEANFPLLFKYQAELAQKKYKGIELIVAPAHKGNGL